MTIRIVNVRGMKTPEQRAGICYVGRAFAGWPATEWGNPYSPHQVIRLIDTETVNGAVGLIDAAREKCLSMYREWFLSRKLTDPSKSLETLWEACEHGAKPLGCWCTTATHGDGSPVVCHAQVLAEMLHERFGNEVPS